MSVIDEIRDERKRQIEKEGYDVSHDDGHSRAELALFAAAYALTAASAIQGNPRFKNVAHSVDPFDVRTKGARRDLVRAAALLVAEIERLDRQPPAPASGNDGSSAPVSGKEKDDA